MAATPGSIQSLRARSRHLLGGAAMLLAFVALAAAGLESVSFGHQHLAGGHALHHHHFYFESHEHPGTDSDHDHDHEKAPPHHHGTPQRSVTVAAASALAQPIGVRALVVPWTEHAPAASTLAPAPPRHPPARLTPPRAPPTLAPS